MKPDLRLLAKWRRLIRERDLIAIPLTPLTFRLREGIAEASRGAVRRERSPGGPV
jgi:hypothetical protein